METSCNDVFYLGYREAGAEESELRVGFVTYAKELHFYNVKVGINKSTKISKIDSNTLRSF